MSSPRDPQTPTPNELAHAHALYKKARSLSTHGTPLDAVTAERIVMTARDAIKEFGSTNQEKKIELEKMIKVAEEVLPPPTIAELKMRAEGTIIRTLHPKGRRLRKFVYASVAILIVFVPAAMFLRQAFKGQDAPVHAGPTPKPAPPDATPTQVVYTATPAPTPTPPSEPSPTPDRATDEPRTDAEPFAPVGPPVRNLVGQWSEVRYTMEWRVASVQPLVKGTRLYVEVRNTHEKNESFFYAFDSFPLVLIDGNGGFHKMLQTSEAPEGVRVADKRWYLQAGRRILVAVDFEPLDAGNSNGHIVYGKQNSADPAKFSLSR
ncbi:MAG TPA: hypothetical protein VGB98_19565 [Pyrinomonadaceae bacterium]|jgi:hypothetical protein